jgi:hypothetical protein
MAALDAGDTLESLCKRKAGFRSLADAWADTTTPPYRSGPSRDWLKMKNPDSPAMVRHREDRW